MTIEIVIGWFSFLFQIINFQNNNTIMSELEDFKKKILNAIADYMYSEGCSCCRDIEAHELNTERIGKLLNVPKYSDDSGYDFSQYRTKD